MAESKLRENTLASGMDIDFYSIIKDVLKNWWLVLILAVSAALLSYVQVNRSYHPVYTIESTYAVTTRGRNNNVINNLNTAQDTASRLVQIINSPTLQAKVAEEMGTTGVQGEITSELVPETNLLMFRVTSSTPEMAFRILRSVMNNYSTLSDYLIGNAIMDVLIAPVIPTEPDDALAVRGPVTKAFLITALVVLLALALVSYWKDTIRKPSDVGKKLDTRLLGTMCHEKKHKTKYSLLITNPMVSFRYVELVQKTCRKVLNRMEQKNVSTLLVTSYLENEGKSTVAANIALALAQTGKRVVLMDLDLRKPSQYKIFERNDLERDVLGNVLSGKPLKEDLIDYLEEKSLFAVLNTKEYSRSTEMLTTGKLETILEYLREAFDYVIIDTPPMAYVADTEEIANLADASLIVVREHIAVAKDINDMLDVLNGCRAVPIGCVFNDAHSSAGMAGFRGYGYGKGYGYGYGYENYYGKSVK